MVYNTLAVAMVLAHWYRSHGGSTLASAVQARTASLCILYVASLLSFCL